MADKPILAGKPVCKNVSNAYWDGALALEDLGGDAERISEMAYALASAEVFEEQAQHAFYGLADLASKLMGKARAQEARLSLLSGKGA